MTFSVYYCVGLILAYWGLNPSDVYIFRSYPTWAALTLMGIAIGLVAFVWPILLVYAVVDAIANPFDDGEY